MRGRRTFAAALLIAAVAIAYGGSLRNGFVFDDAMFVRDDPRVRTLGESQRLFVEPLWGYLDEDGVRHLHQYYRPLQTFPLAVSRAVFPDQAWPAHLINLMLHAANALLVWSILQSLLRRSTLAFGLALLWAVHPAYSEAVLWVSNLAGQGVALSILAIFRLHLSPAAETWRGRVLLMLLLFVGLLFHEIGVITPVLLVAYEAIAVRPVRRRRLGMELAALVPALAVYTWLRMNALGGVLPGFGAQAMGPWELAINAVGLLPHYVTTFVWPFDLNMYHDFDPVSGVADARFLAGATVVGGAAALFVATCRRKPLIAFAVAWMAITTAPYLVIRWPHLNVFAERYLYLPSVGVFLLMGAVWAWAVQSHMSPDAASAEMGPARDERDRFSATGGRARVLRVASSMVAFALLAGVGVVTIWRRIPDWRDDVTLYSKTLTQSKRAWLIRNNLAVHYLKEKRYEEGISVLHDALSASGGTPESAHNLGLLRAALGDDRGALRAFRAASRYGVPRLSTQLNLGYMYDRVGERREAVVTYMRLLARAPNYIPAWFNLAMIAYEAGQYDNARTAAARVLQTAPDDAEALALQRRLQSLAAAGRSSTPAEVGPTRRACRQAMRLARRGHYLEAAAMLKAAAWLDEAAAVPHQYLANIAALRRDLPTALEEQREALKRAPANLLYQRNLEALEKKVAEGEEQKGGR